MVTSYVCSRKAPCPIDVNSWSEAFLHQYVINLVVVFPIWSVPCPSSGWFVRAILRVFVSTRLLKVANSRNLRPGICLDIAVGSTNVSPVCLCILPTFSIPILCTTTQNVILSCLIYGFLELLVEVVNLTVLMTRWWCINLYDGDVERSCSQADWYQSAGDWSAPLYNIRSVLMHKKSNPILMSVLLSTEINLASIICKMWYLSITWVSCWLSVLTFHVPTEMLSLPLIFFYFGTPVQQ